MSCRSCYLLLFFFLFPLLIPALGSKREDLEIRIGPIVIGGSPAPPPRSLQPCDFENMMQYKAYLVIQRFKQTITCDPKNKTGSWSGPRICNNDGRGYEGFYCETPPNLHGPKNRTIASVDFNGFTFVAPTVCGFVDQLPQLALFHANSNGFGTTVPDLTNLPFFYELDVSNNKLTGGFPTNVLPLVNLSFLDLRYNGYNGPIPPSVFDIQTQVLFLNNNKFSGCIPYNLGNTPANYITFAFNMFTGPIPNSIGKLCNTLLEVLFLGNQLSGCLPFEIGLLKNATVFDAGTNRLTGPIPLSFGCLRKVEQLNLAGNLLYGEVPEVVCRLAKYGHLMNLSLSDNYFTSLGPSCLELIECKKLDVRKNCIPWLPKQRSPEECAWFLKRPKASCPTAHYIPCHLPYEGADQLDSAAATGADQPAADGSKDRTSGGYTTYKALNHDEKKP
ncbi:hypothetical protein Cni_G23981 [Canna indica]|uniref:Uncharacterized protein n=1 Tax=Canna indica TaxID=4628 RepID=A0AAQ3KVD3_9LILI|nr:hypothetical protein Cni_G23981 [Canna indica]